VHGDAGCAPGNRQAVVFGGATMLVNSMPSSLRNASNTEAAKKREPTKAHFIDTSL
jgi:hypothetical protein